MSTNVDAPDGGAPAPAGRASRGGRRAAWLAALLVVLLGGGLFALNRTGVFGSDTPAGAAGLDGFQAQLAARIVGVLEHLPADQHGHGDHGGTAAKSTMVCGVRIFGVDPPGAGSIGEVARVYAYHMCAEAEPGREWIMAVKLTGPAVIKLTADPPTVAVAEGGAGFRERVRGLIPERYQAEALNENLTPEGMRELIRRYRDAAGT